MSIKLNEILNISSEEYDNWTICLNHGENGIPETLNTSNKDNYDKLMWHMSYMKSPTSSRSFRVINTKFCLQFIGLRNDKRFDDWLFMGAFENRGEITHKNGHKTYDLKKIDRFSNFAERLVVNYKKHQGDKQAKLNIKNIETLTVSEILPKEYAKRDIPFPGYKDFKIEFWKLAEIVNNGVDNWREHLSKVQCIYAISDVKDKKIYIGSTYGFEGIWQRWSNYVATNGHGGDVKLKEIIDDNPNYAYDNFIFSILEYFYDENKDIILNRENAWKEILQTRSLGYNKN